MNTRTKCSAILFYCMWWSIGLISLVDLYLALRFLDPKDIDTLRQTEKNPFVLQLIEFTGDLSLFAVVKIIGTLIALFACNKIYNDNKTYGFAVCGGVFLFQIFLLIYLLCW